MIKIAVLDDYQNISQQVQLQPYRVRLMQAIWLWITNALSKISPAIQFKY